MPRKKRFRTSPSPQSSTSWPRSMASTITAAASATSALGHTRPRLLDSGEPGRQARTVRLRRLRRHGHHGHAGLTDSRQKGCEHCEIRKTASRSWMDRCLRRQHGYSSLQKTSGDVCPGSRRQLIGSTAARPHQGHGANRHKLIKCEKTEVFVPPSDPSLESWRVDGERGAQAPANEIAMGITGLSQTINRLEQVSTTTAASTWFERSRIGNRSGCTPWRPSRILLEVHQRPSTLHHGGAVDYGRQSVVILSQTTRHCGRNSLATSAHS